MRKNIRRAVLVVLALGALAGQAWAVCPGARSDLAPFAFETLTISTTALPLTATVYAPAGQWSATVCVVSVETNPLRYRGDGLNPSATVGHLVSAGAELEVCGEASIRAIRFIRQGAADSTLMVSCYR